MKRKRESLDLAMNWMTCSSIDLKDREHTRESDLQDIIKFLSLCTSLDYVQRDHSDHLLCLQVDRPRVMVPVLGRTISVLDLSPCAW